jgi:hypothetical protein
MAWSEYVRVLRDKLVPLGWKADDSNNYSTVVSPGGHVSIAAATGGAGTGNPEYVPSTRHPKGPATREAIVSNQLSLPSRLVTPIALPATRTWLFLVDRRRDGDREFIVSEISLPGSITESGWIVTWKPRYILPPIDITFSPGPPRNPDEGEEYDIPMSVR